MALYIKVLFFLRNIAADCEDIIAYTLVSWPLLVKSLKKINKKGDAGLIVVYRLIPTCAHLNVAEE